VVNGEFSSSAFRILSIPLILPVQWFSVFCIRLRDFRAFRGYFLPLKKKTNKEEQEERCITGQNRER
jgi:hypothetical protein